MDGFHVRFRRTSRNEQFDLELVEEPKSSFYLLQDLDQFTEYQVFLVPFHKAVHGHPSNSKIGTTLEDSESCRGFFFKDFGLLN